MHNYLRLKDKIKNVFLGLYILQLFNYIAPLVIIPILIKYIGLGEYGELVYITSIYQIVALIIDFGFTYTGPVVAARHRCETQNLQRYYSIVVLLKSLLFIIALTCVFLLCRLNIVHLSFFGFLSIFLCTIGNILSPNWFLQGIGDFKKLSYSQVIVRITLFIILLVYVCSGGDNVFILSFLQNATLLICCIYLWPNIHISHVVHLKPNECIVEFKKAGNVFIGVIGTIGYNGLIPVLIGNLCGNTSLGVFSIVQKMTTACQSLINPISQYMLSQVSEIKPQDKLFYYRIKKSFFVHLTISITACLCYMGLGQYVATFIGKVDVSFVIILFASIITIFSSLNNVLGIQFLIPTDNVKILRSINVMAGIIVVSLSWLLISRFDILGGVLLNLIGEFLVFSMLAFIAHRKWGARV